MIHSAGVTEDLKILKKEASDLLKSRGNHTQHHRSHKQMVEENSEGTEQLKSSTERAIQDLTSNFEVYLKDFEKTAERHPIVCILAAFALGALVGQVISRK